MPSPPAAASAAPPHPPIEERAAAKLNLDLLVTGRRGDGYHLLDSLVVFLDLADVLRLGPAPALELQVTGPMAGDLDAGEGNLALKAARALAARAGVAAGARLTLEKRLPVAAGIGGGSADAAAALRGLARLWEVELTAGEVAGLALRLGADVPACLFGRPLRLRGIGESLEPLAGVPPLDLVLANPKRPLATADVFRALDRAPVGPERPEGGDLVAALAASRNDLEPAAARLMPEVADVLRELAAEPGCALARMSGSGPTCFGLFPDAAAAQAAAARLAARRPGWWVAASRSGGSPRAP